MFYSGDKKIPFAKQIMLSLCKVRASVAREKDFIFQWDTKSLSVRFIKGRKLFASQIMPE